MSMSASSRSSKLRFRNYHPTTEQLLENKIETAKAPDIDDVTADPEDDGGMANEVSARIIAQTDWRIVQPEQLNIAPKKPNWDLKRDVNKRIEKLNRLVGWFPSLPYMKMYVLTLNRRTQKAIVELIRKRIQEEAEASENDEIFGKNG